MIQQSIGTLLSRYYAHTIDLTFLLGISPLANVQLRATKNMIKPTEYKLYYLASYTHAIIQFYASVMILNIRNNVSYLNELGAKKERSITFSIG